MASAITPDTKPRLFACKDEPAWVTDARLAAWDVFNETPWPKKTDEGWRRTDVSDIPFDEIVGKFDGAAATLTIEAPSGVIVQDLRTALTEHGDLIRERFGDVVYDPMNRKFTSLARALWSSGVFVYVPKNHEAVAPVFVHSDLSAGRLWCPRVLLIAEPGSRVTLVNTYTSPDFDSLVVSSGVSDAFVGDGAEIKYVLLNRWGKGVQNFHHLRSVVGRDAKVTSLNLALGASLTKATIEADLSGAGASSDMLGLAYGTDKQHYDHHTVQYHVVGRTTSDLLFKVALADRSSSMYSGMIRIEHDAQQSNAYQSNQNILLSKKAHADSVPNLEILANDVRCTHGATVAPVDETQVFYMQTRGIPESEARRLVVEGFLDQVLDRAALGQADEYVRSVAGDVLSRGF